MEIKNYSAIIDKYDLSRNMKLVALALFQYPNLMYSEIAAKTGLKRKTIEQYAIRDNVKRCISELRNLAIADMTEKTYINVAKSIYAISQGNDAIKFDDDVEKVIDKEITFKIWKELKPEQIKTINVVSDKELFNDFVQMFEKPIEPTKITEEDPELEDTQSDLFPEN